MKPQRNDTRHNLITEALASIGLHVAAGIIAGRFCLRVVSTAKANRHAA